MTVMIANRTEPSGQVFLTSVCVGKLPTCNPPVAAPCGNAWPKVAQPGVKPTVATGAVCASSVAAAHRKSTSAGNAAFRLCLLKFPPRII